MNGKLRKVTTIGVAGAMLIVTLDTKTAILGANAALELCLKTLIPSLFPFLVLSSLCCGLLFGLRLSLPSKLLRPCRLPAGAEVIFLLGVIGGYPIGAKLVSDAYRRGSLDKKTAEHMLMFCSNAGPAFIFGVLGSLFLEGWVPWILWLLHVLSAYAVGVLTPCNASTKSLTVPKAPYRLAGSMETMGLICCWVILFKILLTFLDKWFLGGVPAPLRIVISGIAELSNGCLLLGQLENDGLRFLLALVMLSLGGSCIAMQTVTVISPLSPGKYLYGKLLQTLLGLMLALPLQAFLFAAHLNHWEIPLFAVFLLTGILLSKQIPKKIVAFRRKMVYNTEKA